MIVLVSMRLAPAAGYDEPRDAIAHDWQELFSTLDVIPVFVPNALDRPERYLDQFPAAGLLLTGGDSLGAADGKPPSRRDLTEARLLDGALARGLPVLGICRGLQMINHHLGGRIGPHGRPGHVATTHPVRISRPVLTLEPGEIMVNSFHDCGVALADVAPGLEVFAQTSDGLAEGFVVPGRPVTAIQWHPERSGNDPAAGPALIERWLSQCA